MSMYVASAISLMSAPAANARSDPVSSTHPTDASPSRRRSTRIVASAAVSVVLIQDSWIGRCGRTVPFPAMEGATGRRGRDAELQAGDALRAWALMSVVCFHITAGVLLLTTGTYDF